MQPEERADAVDEKLTDKQPKLQSVFHHPRDELRVRNGRASDAKEQVNILAIHSVSPVGISSRKSQEHSTWRSGLLRAPGKSACTRNCGTRNPASPRIPRRECPLPFLGRHAAPRRAALSLESFLAFYCPASSEKPFGRDSTQKSLLRRSRRCSVAGLSARPNPFLPCPSCNRRSPRRSSW